MIDIIIPAYNAFETIEFTLDSIVKQSFKDNLNIYIVDDCSTSTYDYLKDKYKEVTINILRYKTNKGPGYARQYGIDHSKSKYIVFIDSDDLFDNPLSLEEMYNAMEKNNYDVLNTYLKEDYYGNTDSCYARFETLHGKIYKRSFLEKYKIRFPYSYNSEDLAFNLLVLLNTDNIGTLNLCSYIYKRRDNSLTQTEDYFREKHIKCYSDGIMYAIKYAKDNNIDKHRIATLLRNQFSYFYFYYKNTMHTDKSIKYIYRLLNDYNKYIKYYKEKTGNYYLNIFIENESNYIEGNEFDEFIAFCNNENKKYQTKD